MKDESTTLAELKDYADNFRRERDWNKHHTHANLSMSIAIEAAELMEKFQWGDYTTDDAAKEVRDELADIIVYCLYLASSDGIDIAATVEAKLKKAAKKYPVELFNKDRDDPADYWRIKKQHRGKA